jgi:hypothetical protein
MVSMSFVEKPQPKPEIKDTKETKKKVTKKQK